MAFGRAAAVGEFVRREAREENFRVRRRGVGVGLLRDEEMAELTEDELRGAGCCAVVGEVGRGTGRVAARGAQARSVEDTVMLRVGCRAVAVARVMWAMPVILPLGRGFDEDVVALWAEDVVPEAEVLMQKKSAFGNILLAVLALDFV